jgi:Ran GTPase-activating protein (RanGAP) involved in mRNA processing and transport
LILKGIITPEDWTEIQNKIRYNFMEDNHFEELKQSEILNNRIQTLRDMDEYVGQYYSKIWVWKNVLQMTEDEIEDMIQEIDAEGSNRADQDEQY